MNGYFLQLVYSLHIDFTFMFMLETEEGFLLFYLLYSISLYKYTTFN